MFHYFIKALKELAHKSVVLQVEDGNRSAIDYLIVGDDRHE